VTDLHQLTDDLNAVLALADMKLASLNFGVRAEIPLGMDGYVLAFMKHDGVWGLHVVGHDQIVFWQHASREKRMLMADCLNPLLDKLRANAVLEAQLVEKSIATVDHFLSRLDDEPPLERG
jgi:hypothetical protein